LELPIVLVSAIVVGGVFGYFLDRWLHTKPYLTLVFGALGFYAGVRDVLRRVARGD
jgi:ATP synthase protein I